jgi:peptidoglycan lytic transglycosylase G
LKKILYTIVISALISILLFISYSSSKLGELPSFSDTITVYVPKNSSVNTIVEKFNKYDLLQPSWLFSSYIKIKMKLEGKSVFAGYYDIAPSTANEDIIDKLFTGGYAKTIKVTIPEGLSNKETAIIIAEKLNLDANKFLALANSDSLLKAWKIPAKSSIGYLLPETYEFFGDESEQVVIDKLLKHHFDFWTEDREDDLKSTKLTKHQLISIASIVQAETPLKSELPTVAGLYLNRVKIGMLLQADPTVQFAVGEKKRLLNKDLEIDSPYNTYKYKGIPPGPINNPGKDALKACLDPEVHDLLYMVAYGDGSGAHYFAKTNAEHSRNVAKYKRARGR